MAVEVAPDVDLSWHGQCTLWVGLSILSMVSEGMDCLAVRVPRGLQSLGRWVGRQGHYGCLIRCTTHTLSLCIGVAKLFLHCVMT